MDWKTQLDKRIKKDLVVPNTEYFQGLVPLIGFLVNDLEKFLYQEGRYFGIMVSYVHRVREILKCLRPELEEADDIIWKRIVFLYKPLILREYKKLLRRRVSKADSVICIVRKILEIVLVYAEEDTFNNFNKIYSIFGKMYSNIKNKGKEYSMPYLSSAVAGSIEEGIVGLHKLDKFSILGEEDKRKAKGEIEGSGIRIEEKSDNLLTEISWTEE